MSADFIVRQQADRISITKVLMVVFAALVIIAVGLVVAWYLLPAAVRHPAPMAAPTHAPPQIGILEQRPFETSNRGLELKTEQLEVLGQYGWVDRDAGIARIPIDRAMDLVLERKRK